MDTDTMNSNFSSLSFIDSSLAHAAARAAFQLEKMKKIADPKQVDEKDLDAVFDVIHYVLESKHLESMPSDPIQRSLITFAVSKSNFEMHRLPASVSKTLVTDLFGNVESLDSLKQFFLRLSESASRARSLAKANDSQDFMQAH